MLTPQITASLNSFFYWLEDSSLCVILGHLIPQYAKEVDGFEISLSFKEMDEWIQSLEQGAIVLPPQYHHLGLLAHSAILDCTANSFHLDDLKSLSHGRERWLASCLNQISSLTGIQIFTTHPDEVETQRWGKVLEALDPGISISIENMCVRKSNCIELDDLADLLNRYPQLSMTFDTSHWLEQGNTLTDPALIRFISAYGWRINKVHLSTSASSAKEYLYSPATSHFLCVNSAFGSSELQIGNFLHCADPVIVLEGLIPIHHPEMLTREIAFVRRLIEDLRSNEQTQKAA